LAISSLGELKAKGKQVKQDEGEELISGADMSGYLLVAAGLAWVLVGIVGLRENRRRGKPEV
jgi:hypothetical protein